MATFNKKKLIYILSAAFLVLILSLVIAEVALRILPIPGIKIRSSKFDGIVGTIYHPHSTVIYSTEKGDVIRRKVNSWGYVDVEHEKEKAKGIYRIGFFGDSYVEAVQVKLEDTFFRIIEKKLENHAVECIAFGMPGRGIVHSYLEYKRRADSLGLDLILYVFCENDLGDNIKDLRGRDSCLPFAILTEDGFQIDNSFRKTYSFKTNLFYKAYLYLKIHSLAIGTIATRTRLLINEGIRPARVEEERMMATKAKADTIPNQNDLPSSWPAPWREYAERLASSIILKWNEEVLAQSRRFAIIYVPREKEMEKPTEDQDSWKPLLEDLCSKNGIVFIDPTPDLLKMKQSGKDVFYDHFTKDGHRAFAESFVDWFITNTY